jgi:hypothetical protein
LSSQNIQPQKCLPGKKKQEENTENGKKRKKREGILR